MSKNLLTIILYSYIINSITSEQTLIKSGGGTGPVKPGNQYLKYMVLNPATFKLKDEYKLITIA